MPHRKDGTCNCLVKVKMRQFSVQGVKQSFSKALSARDLLIITLITFALICLCVKTQYVNKRS